MRCEVPLTAARCRREPSYTACLLVCFGHSLGLDRERVVQLVQVLHSLFAVVAISRNAFSRLIILLEVLMAHDVIVATKRLDDVCFPVVVHNYRFRKVATRAVWQLTHTEYTLSRALRRLVMQVIGSFEQGLAISATLHTLDLLRCQNLKLVRGVSRNRSQSADRLALLCLASRRNISISEQFISFVGDERGALVKVVPGHLVRTRVLLQLLVAAIRILFVSVVAY